LGALKTFSIEKKMKENIVCTLPFCIHVHELASLGGSSVLHHKLTIKVTRLNTWAHTRSQANEGTSEEKETTFRNDVLF
jgi:hypothetical protein